MAENGMMLSALMSMLGIHRRNLAAREYANNNRHFDSSAGKSRTFKKNKRKGL